MHNNTKAFVCGKCDKEFKAKRLLKQHSIVHLEDRPFGCDICEKRFKRKSDLNFHLGRHAAN